MLEMKICIFSDYIGDRFNKGENREMQPIRGCGQYEVDAAD